MLCVVVFYHPGREYPVNGAPNFPDTKVMPWNSKPYHRRKFLQAEGEFVAPDGQGVSPSLLRFWGEWEPDSEMSRLVGDSPKCLHIPFLEKDALSKYSPEMGHAPHCGEGRALGSSDGCEQNGCCNNTDPFVFADHFFYGACQQYVKSGLTKELHSTLMQDLDPGSLILFGSRREGEFVLDTVFVVEDSKKYMPVSMATDLKGFAPSIYPYIMQMGGERKWICYKGANYQNPYHEMYSFVPCRQCNGSEDTGFERPILRESDFQSYDVKTILPKPGMTQGFKKTDVDIAEAQKIWEAVRNSIRKQGFLEGFNFKYSIQ